MILRLVRSSYKKKPRDPLESLEQRVKNENKLIKAVRNLPASEIVKITLKIKPHDLFKTENKGKFKENEEIEKESTYYWESEQSLFFCWLESLRDALKLILIGRDGFRFKV